MKKLCLATCVLLVFCLVCTGCSGANGVKEINADASLSYTNPADFSQYPDHVRKQHSENLFYDMDIVVPTPQQFNTYLATMRIPDEQLYVETFFPNYHKSDVVERDIGQVNPKIEESSYTAEKNGEITELYVSRDETIYTASDLDGYGGAYWYQMQATGLKYPPLYAKCSDQDKDLPSISQQDALDQVNGVIQALGLKVDETPEIYPFTKSQMQEVASFPFHMNGVEEGYFILYRCSVNDVPIFTDYHQAPYIDAVYSSYGSSVNVIVTKSGIRAFHTKSFYDTQLVEENVPIVALETVLEDAATRLQGKYKGKDCLINRAELCYLPLAEEEYDKEVPLKPAWVIDGCSTNATASLDNLDKFSNGEHMRYYYDATTGEIIVTGDIAMDALG